MKTSLTEVPFSDGLRRVGPAGSLLLLTGILVVALASPSLWLKGSVLVGVLGLYRLAAPSRRDRGPIGLRFAIFFAVLLFVAHALSIRDGRVVLDVGLHITAEGLRAGGAMALRFLLILSGSFLFIAITDPDRLAQAFIRWGVPYRFGYVFVLALRFVPFFRDELHTVREAQRLRGIRTSVRSLSGIRKAVRYTFVPVLVSGLVRVDSIAMSMQGRAFGLHATRTPAEAPRWTLAASLAIVGAAALIALAIASRGGSWV